MRLGKLYFKTKSLPQYGVTYSTISGENHYSLIIVIHYQIWADTLIRSGLQNTIIAYHTTDRCARISYACRDQLHYGFCIMSLATLVHCSYLY